MGYAQLVIGPAGSGKSTYCSSLYKHCAAQRTMYIVILDPAAENFEYPVAMDIRELISLDDVMEELGLSPNGSPIYSMEYSFVLILSFSVLTFKPMPLFMLC
ncbi:hypothetical protein HN51_059673 [Arachis hypogaea]|nr:GPN-loop GTPase 3 [Arachis hypogaea]